LTKRTRSRLAWVAGAATLAVAGALALRPPSGWRLLDAAVIAAGLCVALAGAVLLVLRSRDLHRLDRVLLEQQEQNLRFDTAINNMSQGLCFFDGDRRLIVCNHRYADLYKLPRELCRQGTSLEEIVDHRYAHGSSPKMEPAAYLKWRGGIAIGPGPSQTIAELNDGRTMAIHHQPMPGGGWVATHEDITERRRAEMQIERMARHDALTGLPNRVFFRQRLEQQLAALGNGRSLAVLCIDLDRFKAINDTLGHSAGDELLRAVAGRLVECVRENDLVARLGGDEFAIVQVGAPQPAASSALAERLVRSLATPFDIGGHRVSIGASIGTALSPEHGDQPDEVMKRADFALYAAKAEGGDRARLFDTQMDDRARERVALEAGLRRATDAGELELHYQPIFELGRRRAVAAEALLRWHHPTRGLLMPDSFIPLAEEAGLIDTIGEWVLRESFLQAARWPADVGIAVNLSAVQLKSGRLVATVAAALEASGLAPGRVDLEITESVLLMESPINVATLHQLRALGIGISLDDFGVGFSSLSYLRSFPFSKLKIDRSFVRDTASSPQASAIVGAISSLARSLDMGIIAEGIETAEQLRVLVALGCGHGQGYHLSRPAPAAEVAALLNRQVALATTTSRLSLVAGPISSY
jgi:diguanylate cyclase (GGDEF)-like protein